MATFRTFFGASSAAPRVGTQLDPAKTSSYITLSNGNLTATRNAGTPYYATTLSESSALTGELYVEVANTAVSGSAIGVSNTAIADSDAGGSSNWLGFDTNSIGLYHNEIYHNGALLGTLATPPAATDVIGVWVNRTTQEIHFYNATIDEWHPTAYSIASLGSGPLYLGFSLHDVGDVKTVNFDDTFVLADTAAAVRWDGSPISVAASYTLTATTGALALAGSTANLAQGRVLTATSGALALTGTTANLAPGRVLTATTGALALTGSAASLAPGRVLTATSGALALTGTTTGLLRGVVLNGTTGALALTGTATNLNFSGAPTGYTLTATSGTLALTGSTANLTVVTPVSYTLTATSGALALTGRDANLVYGAPNLYTLRALPGDLTLGGVPVDLAARLLEKQPGPLVFGRRLILHPHHW